MSKEIVEKILAQADIRVTMGSSEGTSKEHIQINGSRPWDIQVLNENFYARVLKDGDLGIGESYMDNWWTCQAIDVMTEKAFRADLLSKIELSWTDQAKAAFSIMRASGAIGSSQANLRHHYDIGNDLYQTMLDPYMQYTCAYWRNGATTLAQAQLDKMDMICKKANLKSGDRVLDLGCGWGGLLRYACEKYGCTGVGYNLSTDQLNLAKELSVGMPITFEEADYRDTSKSIADGNLFDAIVNIESIEACGKDRLKQFMQNAYNCLKDNGVFITQVILSENNTTTGNRWLFNDKYIFPGAYAPSIVDLATAMGNLFVIEDIHNFGEDYAKTLLAWNDNFQAAWPTLSAANPEKYTDQFKRMWELYLLSCRGCFLARNVQLIQIVATKTGRTQPLCRYGGVASNPIDNGSR